MIDENECNEEQLYSCDETSLYYWMLPTKFLDINKLADKCGTQITEERVTLLFCNKQNRKPQIKARVCWEKLKSSVFQTH
jgi:hypothetical protein